MIRRALIAAFLGIALTSVAVAQRGGGGRGGGGGDDGDMPAASRGRGRVNKAEAITKELKLSPEQKTEVEALLNEAQKRTTAAMQQYNAVEENLVDGVIAGRNTVEIEKALAASRTQVVGIDVDALEKVVGKLDDKQKSKTPKLFEMISGMDAQAQGVPTSRLETMAKACNLDKDQKKQFKTIFDAGSKETEQYRKQIPLLRSEIAAAAQAGKAQAEIDTLVKSYGGMVAEVAATEIKAFGKAYGLLAPEQQKQGGQMVFAMTSGIFMKKNWEYD